MINVSSMDRIMIKHEDVEKINSVINDFEFNEDHKNNICSQFNQVLITVEIEGYERLNKMYQIISQSQDTSLQLQGVIVKRKIVGESIGIDVITGYYKDGQFKADEKINMDMGALGLSVLTYLYIMSEKREEKTVYNESFVSEEAQERKSVSYKQGKKQKIRKVKILSKRIIRLNTVNEENKRAYNRVTESWGVRGHYRHYKKSGKRVWVNSFKKGEGQQQGKIYEV